MFIIPGKWFYRRKHIHKEDVYYEALHRMADMYRRISLLDLKTGICYLIKADQEELDYLHVSGVKDDNTIAYDEWMRKSVKELVHPDYREEFEALFNMDSLRARVGSEEAGHSMIYKCRSRVGGEYHWVQAEYVARKQTVVPDQVLCYVRDINDRWIAAEKERRRLKDECGREERENQIQTEFMERSSQDLRCSVNMIAALNQLAMHSLVLEQMDMTKHYLSLMNEVEKQILTFLSDVADMTQVQRRGITLACESFDIHHVTEECKKLFHKLDRAHTISFLWSGEWQGLYIGDEKRIELVLFNVLENAVHYNRTGGDIRVVTEQRICPGVADQFIIRITDTGRGISREQQKEIFAPFSRGWDSVSDRPGTGIGLSVAKYILSAMGGSIHIDSEPNAGTEVEIQFSLPRAQAMVMGRAERKQVRRQAYGGRG